MKPTCKKTLHFLSEYLNCRLEPIAAAAIRAHLDRCQQCSSVLQTARETLREHFGPEALRTPPHTTCAA